MMTADIPLTLFLLASAGVTLSIATWPARRIVEDYPLDCGVRNHRHQTPEGNTFCRAMRAPA